MKRQMLPRLCMISMSARTVSLISVPLKLLLDCLVHMAGEGRTATKTPRYLRKGVNSYSIKRIDHYYAER